jgi:hypothetical protein
MAGRKKKGAKRMGRPPRPPEQVRQHRVTATFTTAELAVLQRMAGAQGLPTGTLLYQLVKARLRRK